MPMQNKNLILLLLILTISVVTYGWFSKQPAFQTLMDWAHQNYLQYMLLLVLLKIIAVIWPPIPGGLLTLGSIPIIGPTSAFAADLIGGLIGSAFAYMLGKKYGYSFLNKLFDEDIITKIKTFKINHKREIEAIILIRAFTLSISEAVSYGAGLIGIRLRNLILGNIISSIIVLPYFFIWEGVLNFNFRNIIYNLLIMLPTFIIFYKFKGRYLE